MSYQPGQSDFSGSGGYFHNSFDDSGLAAPRSSRGNTVRRGPAPAEHRTFVPKTNDGGLFAAVGAAVGFVVTIWIVFLVDTFAFSGGLQEYGVQPRTEHGLWGIIFAPVLHSGYEHITANTVSAAIFTALIAFTSKRLWWQVTTVVAIVSGLATWVIGPLGTVHIGASGLVYGWLAFLIVRGFINHALGQIIVGIFLAFSYSGLIWGVFPTDAPVSWQMHLFGAIGGIIAAFLLKRGRERRA
ncbi:rhomboid family intramembrane serine protease [Corynebacterium sp. H113]|uniref:rhomboid family intramembrane serine protease n=1 Tax=Corynebacterium sp. H113 TaxID=3133419 RepID=UPI0030B19029